MLKTTQKQLKNIKKIGKNNDLIFVTVFGSQVSGKTHKESDLDIGILSKNKIGYQQYKNLFGELGDVFKGENVDVRILNDSDPLFRYQAFFPSQLLYGNEMDYLNYKAFAFKDYIDNDKIFKMVADNNRKQVNKLVKKYA